MCNCAVVQKNDQTTRDSMIQQTPNFLIGTLRNITFLLYQTLLSLLTEWPQEWMMSEKGGGTNSQEQQRVQPAPSQLAVNRERHSGPQRRMVRRWEPPRLPMSTGGAAERQISSGEEGRPHRDPAILHEVPQPHGGRRWPTRGSRGWGAKWGGSTKKDKTLKSHAECGKADHMERPDIVRHSIQSPRHAVSQILTIRFTEGSGITVIPTQDEAKCPVLRWRACFC